MNPYERAVRRARKDGLLASVRRRAPMVQRYGFAVPNDEALARLHSLAPLVEVGAGLGYWAYLLRTRGVDIVATDNFSRVFDGERWTFVEEGDGVEVARAHSDRTLLLVWPDYDEPWAADVLDAYEGECVVYVGEGAGGCTGDGTFHERLATGWELVEVVRIPQWEGMHDRLMVYRRREA